MALARLKNANRRSLFRLTLCLQVYLGLSLWTAKHLDASPSCRSQAEFTLVLHGGAGSWAFAAEDEEPYRQLIETALRHGEQTLRAGGSSLEACTAAVTMLEDSGLLNAGRGAVSNSEGNCELDASVMEGARLKAGAVAGIARIKNPILAARLVMERSPHVLLIGEGAEAFASGLGAETIDPSRYYRRCRRTPPPELLVVPESPVGTVGAVAMDRCGNLAAATSTGGYQGKLPGRVGDSAVIGAGTYADNQAAALSATGHGEFFIRYAVTHDIVAKMKYLGLGLGAASERVIRQELRKAGGVGGVIAVDRHGNIAWPFNSSGMLRGAITQEGKPTVLIH